MKPSQEFTPEEEAAAEDAFRLHKQGRCGDDCGFCYDLLLAGEAKYHAELSRIKALKLEHRQRTKPYQKSLPVAAPPRPGKKKGKSAPLAGRAKKQLGASHLER